MAKEQDNTAWMQNLWRPCMGWMYMLICLLDMAVFPVFGHSGKDFIIRLLLSGIH